jgi:hypothetical protein
VDSSKAEERMISSMSGLSLYSDLSTNKGGGGQTICPNKGGGGKKEGLVIKGRELFFNKGNKWGRQ